MGCIRGFVIQILKAAPKLCLDLYFKGNKLTLIDFLTQYVYTGSRKVFFRTKLEFFRVGFQAHCAGTPRKCVSHEGHARLQVLRVGAKSTEISLTVMPVFPHLRKNCSLGETTQVSAVDLLTEPKEKKT